MSLLVAVYVVDPATGGLTDDPRVELPSDLGGFESWRTSVWASEPVRRRGATFLPRLAREDLFVHVPDLAAFLGECRALLSQVREIARELGHDDDGASLAFRLGNFIAAAEAADPEHGVVTIG